MMRQPNQDVMSSAAGDDHCVMKPILPRTPFADDLHVTTGKPLHKLDVVMRNLRRFENVPHRLGRGGRHELALLQHQKKADQLPHRRRVRMDAEWIAVTLVAAAVMFADPDSAAVICVVEMR